MALSSSDSSDGTSNMSQNEDDDWIFEAGGIGAYALLNYRTSLTKIARKVPNETGYQWDQIHLRDPENCYDMFRMRRSVFYMLHDELIDKYGLRSSNEMRSIEALGCVVHLSQFAKQNTFSLILKKLSVGGSLKF
jgi:hypothetical protein